MITSYSGLVGHIKFVPQILLQSQGCFVASILIAMYDGVYDEEHVSIPIDTVDVLASR